MMFRKFFAIVLLCTGLCVAQQQPRFPGGQTVPGQNQPQQPQQPRPQRPGQPGPQPPRQPGSQPPRQPGSQPPRQPGTGPQPSNQGIPPCIQEIRQLEATCFQNAGFQMPIADAIILNQTNRLPANAQYADLRNGICNKRAELIQCVVPPILNKRGQPPCTNQAEFNFVENEMVRRMTALQHTCGAGGTTKQKPCMGNLDRLMFNCYQQVGLNANIFNNNKTQIRGAIIGVDKESTQQYCSLRRELFDCQRKVIKNCDGAEDYMLVTGYDHDAMEESIELLCGDTEVYLNGLQCFQSPTQLGVQCMRQMSSRLLDLAAKKIQNNLNMTAYYEEYCEIRVEHLGCDIEAWKTKCTEVSVGLKNEYECTMLPNNCKNIQGLHQKLKSQTCAQTAFFKELRGNSGTKQTLTFGGLLSIALGLLITVL